VATSAPAMEHSGGRLGGRLVGKIALISGGDTAVGRAVAMEFAREGANVAMGFPNEHSEAVEVRKRVESFGRSCLLLPGDLSDSRECERFVIATLAKFDALDILVNVGGDLHAQDTLEQITDAQLERTFRTNVFAAIYLTRAAVPYLKKGASIINTVSTAACRGDRRLIDYSAAQGAIVGFTRSLASAVAERGIRVNAVAPVPFARPFGKEPPALLDPPPRKKSGEPVGIAPCYVFLASDDSCRMSGQILFPGEGELAEL